MSRLPAHAGMDPLRTVTSTASRRLPRTRGDGPHSGRGTPEPNRAPPHTRGWTRRCRAAVRQGEAPPHTRGWTLVRFVEDGVIGGSPAHAGMDPPRSARQTPIGRLPRTRGDGPGPGCIFGRARAAPPHTRGWTRGSTRARTSRRGSPAHAGMDPEARRRDGGPRGLPRTRGDGPVGEGRFAFLVTDVPPLR